MAYTYVMTRADGGIDDKGIRKYTSRWLVQTDGPIGPASVATLVPNDRGDSWVCGTDTDTYATLKRKNATMVELGTWEVVCEYDNLPSDVGLTTTGSEPGSPTGSPMQGGADVAPTDRPWHVQIDTVEVEVPLVTDVVTGENVAASNGQVFDPPITVPSYRPQITITGYKALGSDSYANVALYTGKVNDGSWMGFADQTVLCKKYSIQTQYDHGAWFWQKTVVLEIKHDKWNPVRVLDQGSSYLQDTNTSKPPQAIKDQNGQPTGGGVYALNGAGKPLSVDDINAGSFSYREFNAYITESFASIL